MSILPGFNPAFLQGVAQDIGSDAWELLHTWDFAIDGATPPIVDVSEHQDVLVIFTSITLSTTGQVFIRCSADGVTFDNGNNYRTYNTTGTVNTAESAMRTGGNTPFDLWAVVIRNLRMVNVPKPTWSRNETSVGARGMYVSASTVAALTIVTSGQTLAGGKIHFVGRRDPNV